MVDRSREREIMQLAARQFGVVTRPQARMFGTSLSAIDRRVNSGIWEPIYPGIYRIIAVPRSYHQSVVATAYWAQGLASHRSALRLWDLGGYRGLLVEVTATGKRARSRRGVKVHFSDHLPSCDEARMGLLRVTSVNRTLIDAGAVVTEAHVEEALESALRQGLTTLPQLAARIDELCGRGRRGCGALRALLDKRRWGDPPTASPLETIISRLLARHGLPIPVRQYEVVHQGAFVARPDFAYPELQIAIEGQSFKHHGTRVGWERDSERFNRLQELGWVVILVTWRDATARPGTVAERVRTAIANRATNFSHWTSPNEVKHPKFVASAG
jgi:putative AbiEi antitoxin of type IV toxin-antitoxin system